MSIQQINHHWRWMYAKKVDTQVLGASQTLARAHATGSEYREIDHSNNGYMLVQAYMNSTQLLNARKEDGIIVLPSIHDSTSEVHADVIDAHAHLGATRGMKMHQFLLKLAESDPRFEPMD